MIATARTTRFDDDATNTTYITPIDLVDCTSTACYDNNWDDEEVEFEEVKVNHKEQEVKFSVPKGSLDYDPRQKVPLYCPSVRVNNGRRR